MKIELGDIVAEHENRIEYLENSLPGTSQSYIPEDKPPERPVPQSPWEGKQWEIINQLRAEVRHIHAEVHELKTAKKRHGGKYD